MPYPPKDGEAIAILTIAKGLAALEHQVTILAMNTPKHHFPLAQIPETLSKQIDFHTIYVDTSIRPLAAFVNLFSSKSYNIQRFFSKAYLQKIKDLLQEQTYDIIQLEGVYLTPYLPYIRQWSKAKVIMRAHNVESEIWERLAKEETNWLKRQYLKFLAHRLQQFERKHLNDYDGMVPISVKDEAFFKQWGLSKPVWTLAVSLATKEYVKAQATPEANSLFFIGSLDWLPNLEGLQWFIQEVWPALLERMPALQLYIAGRNIPQNHQQLMAKNIKILGEVPDAKAYMNSKKMMIVPLFSGSGMRVKIIEAMALGKPIIATTLAAEGIAYQKDKELIIADTKKEFIEKIYYYMNNSESCKYISKEAINFVKAHHDNDYLIQQLVKFYQEQL